MHEIYTGVIADDADRHFWDLQRFADGGAPGGGEGDSAAGVTSADAGQSDGLDNLGIPKEKLDRYRAYKARNPQPKAEEPAREAEPQAEQAAAAEEPKQPEPAVEEESPDADLDKTMDRPEVKKRIQDIIRKRVASFEDQQQKIAPILEIIGQKYGLDVSDLSKLDFADLANRVANDESFFEGKAEELGSSPETAKRVFEAELSEKRKALEEQNNSLKAHFEGLQAQANELAQRIPGFNLMDELTDRRFVALVSPELGFSVEEAYNAIHHDEIVRQRDAMAVAAAKRAATNTVMAGKSMPSENGTVSRSSEESRPKLYSEMNPAERAEWLKAMKAKGSTGRMS